MATRVDTEEIASTRSERFVAVALAAFLLIGTIWFYAEVDSWARDVSPNPSRTAAERAAINASESSWKREEDAAFRLEQARTKLEVAEEGADRTQARAEFDAATAEVEAARVAAEAASEKADRAWSSYEERISDVTQPRDMAVAAIRLLFAAGWTQAGFLLIRSQRKRESRYLPLGFAVTSAGVVTALVFAADYITDYIDPLDLGPFVLSVLGAAASIAGFVVLQRHLASRIPGRRVRKGECPFCGFPVRDGSQHCEGCGREVVASCAQCSEPRRVGSTHCRNCGAS